MLMPRRGPGDPVGANGWCPLTRHGTAVVCGRRCRAGGRVPAVPDGAGQYRSVPVSTGQWKSMDAPPASVVTDPGHRKLPEVLVAVKARLTYFPVAASRSHAMLVAL